VTVAALATDPIGAVITTSPTDAAVTTVTTVTNSPPSTTDANRPVTSLRAGGKNRAARLRQLSVLGVFTSVAMVSARVPAAVIVPVMIVVLAGIDIAGGIVAKSWALGRSPWVFGAGVVLFVLLFWVYGMSLRHGELSTITIGWVVLVTLADMGLDRFYYDVHFPLSKWIAALAAVALLAYLLVGTDSPRESSRSTSPTIAPAAAPVSAPTAVPATAHTSVPTIAPIIVQTITQAIASTTAQLTAPTTAPRSVPPTAPANPQVVLGSYENH
jgi:hypothetical protein